jgi:hypothetical protein
LHHVFFLRTIILKEYLEDNVTKKSPLIKGI